MKASTPLSDECRRALEEAENAAHRRLLEAAIDWALAGSRCMAHDEREAFTRRWCAGEGALQVSVLIQGDTVLGADCCFITAEDAELLFTRRRLAGAAAPVETPAPPTRH